MAALELDKSLRATLPQQEPAGTTPDPHLSTPASAAALPEGRDGVALRNAAETRVPPFAIPGIPIVPIPSRFSLGVDEPATPPAFLAPSTAVPAPTPAAETLTPQALKDELAKSFPGTNTTLLKYFEGPGAEKFIALHPEEAATFFGDRYRFEPSSIASSTYRTADPSGFEKMLRAEHEKVTSGEIPSLEFSTLAKTVFTDPQIRREYIAKYPEIAKEFFEGKGNPFGHRASEGAEDWISYRNFREQISQSAPMDFADPRLPKLDLAAAQIKFQEDRFTIIPSGQLDGLTIPYDQLRAGDALTMRELPASFSESSTKQLASTAVALERNDSTILANTGILSFTPDGEILLDRSSSRTAPFETGPFSSVKVSQLRAGSVALILPEGTSKGLCLAAEAGASPITISSLDGTAKVEVSERGGVFATPTGREKTERLYQIEGATLTFDNATVDPKSGTQHVASVGVAATPQQGTVTLLKVSGSDPLPSMLSAEIRSAVRDGNTTTAVDMSIVRQPVDVILGDDLTKAALVGPENKYAPLVELRTTATDGTLREALKVDPSGGLRGVFSPKGITLFTPSNDPTVTAPNRTLGTLSLATQRASFTASPIAVTTDERGTLKTLGAPEVHLGTDGLEGLDKSPASKSLAATLRRAGTPLYVLDPEKYKDDMKRGLEEGLPKVLTAYESEVRRICPKRIVMDKDNFIVEGLGLSPKGNVDIQFTPTLIHVSGTNLDGPLVARTVQGVIDLIPTVADTAQTLAQHQDFAARDEHTIEDLKKMGLKDSGIEALQSGLGDLLKHADIPSLAVDAARAHRISADQVVINRLDVRVERDPSTGKVTSFSAELDLDRLKVSGPANSWVGRRVGDVASIPGHIGGAIGDGIRGIGSLFDDTPVLDVPGGGMKVVGSAVGGISRAPGMGVNFVMGELGAHIAWKIRGNRLPDGSLEIITESPEVAVTEAP